MKIKLVAFYCDGVGPPPSRADDEAAYVTWELKARFHWPHVPTRPEDHEGPLTEVKEDTSDTDAQGGVALVDVVPEGPSALLRCHCGQKVRKKQVGEMEIKVPVSGRMRGGVQ